MRGKNGVSPIPFDWHTILSREDKELDKLLINIENIVMFVTKVTKEQGKELNSWIKQQSQN